MDRVDRRSKVKDRFEVDASGLMNIYWLIRYARRKSDLRKQYRKAQKEKARLTGLGHDPEVIRLYRLWLKNPRNEERRKRFEERVEEPYQMSLFEDVDNIQT